MTEKRRCRKFARSKVVVAKSESTVPTLPEQLEKAFRSQFGLVIKICYNDENDNRYYISKSNSEYKLPIGRLNKEFC